MHYNKWTIHINAVIATQYHAEIMLLCLQSALGTMKHKVVIDFTLLKCFSIHTSPPSFLHNSAQCQKGREKTSLSILKPNICYIIFYYNISFCHDTHDVCDTTEGTSLINRPTEYQSKEFRKRMYYFATSKAWGKKWFYKKQIVMKTKGLLIKRVSDSIAILLHF